MKLNHMMSNAKKSFSSLAINMSVLHNSFDSLTKLFSDVYLTKFLDTLAKPFFSCGGQVCVCMSLFLLYFDKIARSQTV